MARTYKSQILHWNWPGIVSETRLDAVVHKDSFIIDLNGESELCSEGCDGEGHVGSSYLGSVMQLTPSGKFYVPWTTNQTADDVERDGRWYAALEDVATKMGGWIENGEGDPTDLYFMRYWPVADVDTAMAPSKATN
jgi:hypothetical protein